MITKMFEQLKGVNLGRIFWIVFILAVGFFIAKEKIATLKQERDRYRNNYEAISLGVEQMIIADSLRAVKIRELELSKDELRTYYEGKLMQTLREMDIRLRRMESFTTTAVETTNNINTMFRDSIIKDTIKVEKLSYHSKWFDIDILKEGHEAAIKSISRDSIIQVVYWERKGFWPLRWTKRKIYSQNIMSANPDSRIKYSRYIVPERLTK